MSNRRRANKPWLAIDRPLNPAEIAKIESRRKAAEKEKEKLLTSTKPPSTKRLREWLKMVRD